MESRTAIIEFEISEEQKDEALNLPPGHYKAEVKEVNSTSPVQYQICNFNAEDDCDKKPFEDQLILMRQVNGRVTWIEAHHNSQSELIQTIGNAIDKAFPK